MKELKGCEWREIVLEKEQPRLYCRKDLTIVNKCDCLKCENENENRTTPKITGILN